MIFKKSKKSKLLPTSHGQTAQQASEQQPPWKPPNSIPLLLPLTAEHDIIGKEYSFGQFRSDVVTTSSPTFLPTPAQLICEG